MKLDKKVKWLLVACGGLLIILTIWISCFIKQTEIKEAVVKNQRFQSEKTKNGSEWLRYQVIQKKLLSLGQGWKRPTNKHSSNIGFDGTIPINEAVVKQITEIERIHEEEILGKLSDDNRIYHEYQQNLLRELKVKVAENDRIAKTKLESDLASEKKRQNQAFVNFRKDLERKYQLILINLELQKKMLVFNSINQKNQQSEAERIDLDITRLRNDIQKRTDERSDEMDQEFELYQKRRTAEYHAELSRFRKEKQELIQTELHRFRGEQMNEFKSWNNQRQTEVEKAIELRRFQQ